MGCLVFYAGQDALKSWKNATREQRSRLAEDIVVGGTLKGLSRAEIVDQLQLDLRLFNLTTESNISDDGFGVAAFGLQL